MSKHTDPLLVALKEGRSFTWTIREGGDLASMRAALKHGQTLTMSPVADLREVQVGDIVFVKWHQGHMLHLVQEVQDDRFLIANSVGKVNGWVNGSDILGRVTHIVEPEPRPDVPILLDQLEAAYRQWIKREQPTQDQARRLLAVVDDLRWYADRLGAERWDTLPRLNKWSFQQRLWQLTKQAKQAAASTAPQPAGYLIDQGKQCVGLAAEIFALFEYAESD